MLRENHDEDELHLSFPKTLAAEVVSGLGASFVVSPVVAIIDRSIIEDASGKRPLMAGVREGFRFLLTKPHRFVRAPAFLMIWGVFAGTYTVANVVESTCHHYKRDWFWPKFGFSSITNVTLSVTKDHYYTQWFGAGTPHKIPFGSYFMYGTRDAMTIMASFVLPQRITPVLEEKFGVSHDQANTMAQLIAPCAVQALSTPLHLYGIDLYNHKSDRTAAERIKFIRLKFWSTLTARVSRIFPAFSIGGIVNRELRHYTKEMRI